MGLGGFPTMSQICISVAKNILMAQRLNFNLMSTRRCTPSPTCMCEAQRSSELMDFDVNLMKCECAVFPLRTERAEIHFLQQSREPKMVARKELL